MSVSLHSERLYLQRDSELDIYIDLLKPLPQHQLDGIRFLFRHFKKKTPGVILNDPSGYGKCHQVVLFLNALRSVVKKPILVLSDDVNNWKKLFEQIWTNCDEELLIRARNPTCKKLVHINPVEDGFNFGCRCWSIVVVHDIDCTQDLLKTSFNAEYKIWVTSTDLKENLRVLSSIYEWLHPKKKFNTEDFVANKNDIKDVFNKALQLDRSLEDFLIRRNNFKTPFRKDRYQKPAPAIPESPPKTTRKNKDPTGTKVKRSRKRIIDDDDIEEQNVVFAKRNTVPNISYELPFEDSKDMDVENFIRDQKPISYEGFKDFIQDSNDSSDLTVTEKDLGFENVLKAIRSDKEALEGSMNGLNAIENNDNDSHSISLFTGNNSIPDKEVENENNHIVLISKIIKSETEDSKDSPTVLIYTETDDNNSVINENNLINITIVPETEQSEDTDDVNSTQNSANWNISESEEKFNNDTNIESKSDVEDKNDNTDCKNNVNGTVKAGGNILSDIDAKLAEHEAMALKRFKGTLLDRLF